MYHEVDHEEEVEMDARKEEEEGEERSYPPLLPPGPVEPAYIPRGRIRFVECSTED